MKMFEADEQVVTTQVGMLLQWCVTSDSSLREEMPSQLSLSVTF